MIIRRLWGWRWFEGRRHKLLQAGGVAGVWQVLLVQVWEQVGAGHGRWVMNWIPGAQGKQDKQRFDEQCVQSWLCYYVVKNNLAESFCMLSTYSTVSFPLQWLQCPVGCFSVVKCLLFQLLWSVLNRWSRRWWGADQVRGQTDRHRMEGTQQG